jgi:hypothetical protein
MRPRKGSDSICHAAPVRAGHGSAERVLEWLLLMRSGIFAASPRVGGILDDDAVSEARLRQLLRHLPRDEQRAVACHLHQMTHREIAARMHIRPERAFRLLREGYAKLLRGQRRSAKTAAGGAATR